MRRALTVLSLALSLGGCGSKSIIGQPCQKAGDTQCDLKDDPNRLARCDGSFFVAIADCATQCIANKPPVQHTGATIDADETWACADGPHELTAPITVSAGITLTIEAGAEILLQPASHIATDPAGRIEAIGTDSATILVTAANKTRGGFGDDGNGGIDVFAAASGTPSDLEHVVIERGVQGLAVLGLSPTATAPIVKNNTLRDNVNFGIIVTCDTGAQIPDFKGDGNLFFGNGAEVGACNQEQPGG